MIITNNEEAIRINCDDVLPEEVGTLVNQLENELKHSAEMGAEGIGLAAPQCGIGKKIAIVRLGKYKINLVNAKIEKGYDQNIFDGEGCLSFPGRFEKTSRFQEIYVSNDVEPYKFTATGLFAVVCAHEIDHLSGVLLSDIAIKDNIKTKIRPNDICFCGSNRKYKKCCQIKGL